MSVVMNPNGSLGKDAFLQLMVTQLKNQDPLQPQDNSQFLQQLAQYTTMEQETNIAQNTTESLQVSTLAFEHQMLGQTVKVTDGNNNIVSGAVTGIQMNNGNPMLMIGGNSYPLSALVEMDAASPSTTTAGSESTGSTSSGGNTA